MTKILNIALVTEEAAGIRLLRSLNSAPHHISVVFCSPATTSLNNISVWNIAQDMGICTRPTDDLKLPTTAQQLKDTNIDLLISVRSPAILGEDIIAAPRIGAFNLHTGPLPGYAGRNVISWAIFNGESSHGVTLHQLTAEIDGGDIIYQSFFPIKADETALDITGKSIKEGITLVQKLIDQVALNPAALPNIHQDNNLRHYYDQSIPNHGRIDWSWEAKKIVNFVRACHFYPLPSPWGHPLAKCGEKKLQLLSVQRTFQTVDAPPGSIKSVTEQGVMIACADEWLLVTDVIIDGVAQVAAQGMETP